MVLWASVHGYAVLSQLADVRPLARAPLVNAVKASQVKLDEWPTLINGFQPRVPDYALMCQAMFRTLPYTLL